MERLDVRSGEKEQFDARTGLDERFKRLKRENFQGRRAWNKSKD